MRLLPILFLAGGLARFAELPPDALAFEADALAFIRFGRPDVADLRGELSDLLLVRAAHGDLVRAFHGDRDAGGRLDHDRMREADLQRQLLALHLRAVA